MKLRHASFPFVMALLTFLGSAFLLLPLVVIVVSSFGEDTYLRFPPRGFTLDWYKELLELGDFVGPLWVSIQLGVAVAVTSAICGAMAAYALSRSLTLFKASVESALLAPVLLPTLIIGLALLVLFNRLNVTNAWLTLFFGHVVVTLPFVLQTTSSTLATLSPRLELAGMSLGARPLAVLTTIVAPLAMPGIIAGGIIAFALSFDEFVVSVLLAQGPVTPFPVQLFQYMRFSVSPVLAAMSTLLIVATSVIILAFHKIVGLETLFGAPRWRR